MGFRVLDLGFGVSGLDLGFIRVFYDWNRGLGYIAIYLYRDCEGTVLVTIQTLIIMFRGVGCIESGACLEVPWASRLVELV